MTQESTPHSAVPAWLARAQARGWLPAGAAQAGDVEPSPLLTALVLVGAVFCSAPLLAFLGLGLSEALLETAAGYVVGVLAVAGALWWLRHSRHIFATCIGLELWVLGLTLVLVRWLGDWHGADAASFIACAIVSAALLGSALLIPTLWIGRIMGLALAPALMAALLTGLMAAGLSERVLLALSPLMLPLVALAWAGWCWREARWLGRPLAVRCAALADGFAIGMLVCAVWTGSFVELSMREGWLGRELDEAVAWRWMYLLPHVLAVPLVLACGWALARRWSSRQAADAGRWKPLLALACATLALAAWFSPAVATVALLAATAAASARWRLLAACGLAVLWLLASFYYSLAWTLASKGLGLALLGAALVLGLLVLRARVGLASAASSAAAGGRRVGVLVLLGGVLALGLANVDVWRKETVIAQGQRILVPLAPVDPRSLMQGDYMQLRFTLPPEVSDALRESSAYELAKRATVLARLNTHGQAELLRLAQPGEALGEGEILLPLKQLKGDWVVVTDAYFFAEGQGRRFERARFGDFRVLPDGRALLVGLADAEGDPIAAYERLPLDADGAAIQPEPDAESPTELPAAVAPTE